MSDATRLVDLVALIRLTVSDVWHWYRWRYFCGVVFLWRLAAQKVPQRLRRVRQLTILWQFNTNT
jgi:hypothetical protein